jgi:hypothetical protein
MKNKQIQYLFLINIILFLFYCEHPEEFNRNNPIDPFGDIFFTTNLKESSYVKGNIYISVNETAKGEIAKVDFLIDNKVIATDIDIPFQITWNSMLVDDGEHILSCKVYNQSNNFKTENTKIIVDNTSPAIMLDNIQGDTLIAIQNISISGSILENIKLNKLEIQFDDSLINMTPDNNFEFIIENDDFLDLSLGHHKLFITCSDMADNRDSLYLNIKLPYELGRIVYNNHNNMRIIDSIGHHKTDIMMDNPYSRVTPCWSPAGNKICFSVGTTTWGVFELCIIDLDLNTITPLTNNGLVSMYPSWSPDGEKIVYQCYDDANQHQYLRIINIDGSNDHVITDKIYLAQSPCWSPDGREVLYVKNYSDLVILNLDNNQERRIAQSSSNFKQPDWSYALNQIIVEDDYIGILEIFTPMGDILDSLGVYNFGYSIYNPSFSPDGSKIVFNDTYSGSSLDNKIYIMDLSTENVINIENDSPSGYPDWR